MSLLPVPLISQQTPLSWDGKSPNQEMDCVPTCILAGLMALNGIKAMDDKEWNPDHILDMAYPEGYTGGTDAARYVAPCLSFGVKLFSVQGNPGTLVDKIHAYLADGCPCIITIPDPYVPSSYGWTHVLLAFSDEIANTITFLDTWPGKPVTKSNQEWMQLLLNSQIWVMQKNGDEDFMAITINTPGVATQFAELDATHWRSKKTGKIIQDAILTTFKAYGYITGWGHPLKNESYYAPGKSRQFFENCVPGWDASAGKVTLLPLFDNGPATDPAVIDLVQEKTALQAEVATLKAHPHATTDPQAVAALALVKQLKTQVAPF